MKIFMISLVVVGVTLVIGCKKAVMDIPCSQSVKGLAEKAFDGMVVKCPAACENAGSLWGTDTYTTDSSICKAAIHAGVITPAGGLVKVKIKSGEIVYTGTARNGVTSNSWGPYEKSFTVEKHR